MTTTPSALAMQIARDLRRTAVVRTNYLFTIPHDGGVRTGVVDSAIFSTLTPSFHSAVLAITRVNGRAESEVLHDLGYLGAPLVLLERNSEIAAFEFTAPLVAEEITRTSQNDVSWQREVLPRLENRLQPTLPGLEARELILGETTSSLRLAVSAMMEEVSAGLDYTEPQAFSAVVSIIRHLALRQPLLSSRPEYRSLAERYKHRISFDNVPLESVGELYESLATNVATRRATGVFYTPAWLARRIVERLPSGAFSEDRVFDPACGSGTFLVCYLERFLDERKLREPGFVPSADHLARAVGGMDVDSVALESTRLTLDLLAQRLAFGPQDWSLELNDATSVARQAGTLIGNLPFGYRTHQKTSDISSAILELWLSENHRLRHLALLLPESFLFSGSAAAARRALLDRFRIEELLRLPEAAFDTSKVLTVGVIASEAPREEVVIVRDVAPRELDAFRVHGIAKSFSSTIPLAGSGPWVISPFYKYFSAATRNQAMPLGSLFDVHVGLKAYGSGPEILSPTSEDPTRRLLDDAKLFLEWHPEIWRMLPRLVADPRTLHRPGPVDQFPQRKLILRSLTNRRQRGRLAAVYDQHGVWFTNRFTGVWAREPTRQPSLGALAAYLQTSFVELWFASSNPSRTLRIGGLRELPLPRLPGDWWQRAEALCEPDSLTVAPRWRPDSMGQLLPVDRYPGEWSWFEAAVLTAFGIPHAARDEVATYLSEYLGVGSYPS
jgi:hypothetical protein